MRRMADVDLEQTYLGFSVRSMRSKWLICHTTLEHDDEYGDYEMRWYLTDSTTEDGQIIWSDGIFEDDVLVFTKREATKHLDDLGLAAEIIELSEAAR